MRRPRLAQASWKAVFALMAGVSLLLGSFSRADATPQQSLPSARSAGTTALGVVWTPPTPPDSALHELDRIATIGATAVRLTRLPPDTIAARADSLGLDLYVDLPVAYVSARQLPDALRQAAPTLERLQALARQHASITHVGLARVSDTTVPAACETLRRWTDRVHAGNSSLRTYYVTPFSTGADRCAEAVDRPLLDMRNHPAPMEQWHQWRSRRASVGLGAVGTWVDPNAASGLKTPHSSEHQARYLEDTLSQFFDSPRTSPVLFVSRWRDRSPPLLSSRRYGLHEDTGTPRPAARVVRGLFTGTQNAFAFPQGTAPSAGGYGLVLLGWGLVALLGGLYATSLFVRRTAARYFMAPGFYRDALRDERDLHPGTNGLLMGVVAGALGITTARVARQAATHPLADRVLAALPPAVKGTVAGGLEHSLWAGVAVGGVALGLLGAWMAALVLTARWWTRFSVAQGLVLVTWPCWPVLLGPPLALAAGPEAPVSPSLLAIVLLGGAMLTCLYITARVLYDYWIVTGLPRLIVLALGILSPFGLAGATVLGFAIWDDVSLPFLWHLATQT